MFKLINFVFCKYTPILNVMPATHSKKSWDWGMLTTLLHHLFF